MRTFGYLSFLSFFLLSVSLSCIDHFYPLFYDNREVVQV